MKVGVYAVQGDVAENVAALENASASCGIKCQIVPVTEPEEIETLDALVIPGGESTVMGGVGNENGSLLAIRKKAQNGMPVLGICAGMVLLARQASDLITGSTGQPLLELLDMQVERNSFGRQKNSFETYVAMDAIKIPKTRAVFIRAPSVHATGPDVETIAKFGGKIVAVRSGKIMATAFHPELGNDSSVYARFLETI